MEEEIKTLGGKCYYEEIIKDYQSEPFVECETEKRRRCDSFYIKENKKLKKQIEELKKLCETYSELLSLYKDSLEQASFNGVIK